MADTKLVICEKCWGKGHVNGGNENSTWSKTCEDCHGIGFLRVPMTNADRIRSMNEDELAKILGDKCICPPTGECAKMSGDCAACWLQWLQQPSKEV